MQRDDQIVRRLAFSSDLPRTFQGAGEHVRSCCAKEHRNRFRHVVRRRDIF